MVDLSREKPDKRSIIDKRKGQFPVGDRIGTLIKERNNNLKINTMAISNGISSMLGYKQDPEEVRKRISDSLPNPTLPSHRKKQ